MGATLGPRAEAGDQLERSLLGGSLCSDEVVDVPPAVIVPLGSFGFMEMSL